MFMIVLYFSVLLIHVRADLALLSVESADNRSTHQYCVAYDEEWNIQLPANPSHYLGPDPTLSLPHRVMRQYYITGQASDVSTRRRLAIPDGKEQDGCHNFSTSYDQSAVLISNSNCSVSNKLRTAQFADVQLLIISGTLDTKGLTDLPVAMVIISEKNADNLDNGTMVTVYLPKSGYPFGGIILLCAVAMVTLIAASALANEPYKFLRNGLLYRNGKPAGVNNLRLSIWQTAFTILLFVTLVIAFLVLLYFFYSIVVYVAIAIYCLLCVRSIYSFLSPFVALISFTSQWRLPANNWPLLRHQPDPRFFLTVLFSIVIVTTWFVLRHASYAWMLHDLLGFMFICFAVKQFKPFLAYLWPLALLMIVLFVYDVFFVFITPLFTKDSVSVMETVATGQGTGSNEKIPFLFEVPRLVHRTGLEMSCDLVTPLLLGYGDVGLPAVLISFALRMDKMLHPNTTLRVYYLITVIGYAIGFLLCIIALTLMKTGQPALLYLVPCTLIPFLVAAMIRGELLTIWRGKKKDTNTITQPQRVNCEEKEIKDKECEDIEPLLAVESIVTTES